jgi:hypothetical protein
MGSRPVRSPGIAPLTAAAVAWPLAGAATVPPVRHPVVDHTEARNDILVCFGRSDRRTLPTEKAHWRSGFADPNPSWLGASRR